MHKSKMAKAKTYNTYTVPQAAYRSCSGTFVSQSGRAAYRLLPANNQPYASLSCQF